MNDQLDVPATGQTHAGRPAAGLDVIPWGSAAAQEAVNRICQQVTARCEEVIVAQAAAETPGEDAETEDEETESLPTVGKSTEADGHQP